MQSVMQRTRYVLPQAPNRVRWNASLLSCTPRRSPRAAFWGHDTEVHFTHARPEPYANGFAGAGADFLGVQPRLALGASLVGRSKFWPNLPNQAAVAAACQ